MDLSTSLSSATHPPILNIRSDNDLLLAADPSLASARRNNVRLQAELSTNTTIIGMSISFHTHQHLLLPTPTPPPPQQESKHLSNDIDDILPPIFASQHPGIQYPNDFLAKVKLVSSRKSKTPRQSSLRFEVYLETANHNARLLSNNDFDVSKLISHPKSRPISPTTSSSVATGVLSSAKASYNTWYHHRPDFPLVSHLGRHYPLHSNHQLAPRERLIVSLTT
jgi:hypothetical protein